MEVSSRRLAIVQHRHPPARGLLSLISLLRAFPLTGINRNQSEAKDQYRSLLNSIGLPLGPSRAQPNSPVGGETFKEVWQPRFLRVSPSSG